MNKKYLLGGGIAVLLIVCVAFVGVYMKKSKVSESTGAVGTPAVIIMRTDTGFVPSEVTIKKGDIVLWKNESSDYDWPASDLHPTHALYPEFDPLRPIAPGSDWSFKFDKVGVWKFHDHIRANKVGTVTVTE